MPITRYTDSNGNTYNALGTAAWLGAEGATLRSQGWTYCGFGTGGVYLAPPGGGPCSTRSSSGPSILPPAPPPENLAPSNAVPDRACTRCTQKTTATAPSSQITGAPAPTPGARPAPKPALPWWLWVLAALTLAQVIHGRNA